MTRKFLCLLLFSSLIPLSSFLQACASPSCGQYIEQLNACSNRVLTQYGDKQQQTCKLGAKNNKCAAGELCAQGQGEAFASCFQAGEVYKNYKELITSSERFCDGVFAGRQNAYLKCAMDAGCDTKKLNACKSKLMSLTKKAKKEGELSGFLVSFLAFLLLAMILEGLLVFILIKVFDGQNPKNTILRALMVGAGVGVMTFPLVYLSPLLGVLVSSSALFGIVMLVYQQEAFFSTTVTAVHIVWVQIFFTAFVSYEMMHGSAWIAQAEHFRRGVISAHEEVETSIADVEKDRKRAKEAAIRAKEEEKKRKEEAARKKKEEEEKKKQEEEEKKNKKKKRRRR